MFLSPVILNPKETTQTVMDLSVDIALVLSMSDLKAQFIDMETGEEMHVIPEFLRQEYLKLIRSQIAAFEAECQKDRMDYALIDTSQPLDQALFTYLARRSQLY